MGGVDLAEAVNGLAERVHGAAEHGAAHGDVHDAARGAALVAFLDRLDGAEQNGTDLVAVEVLGQAVHGLARLAALELEELAGHGALQTRDARDAVADLVDSGNLMRIDRGGEAVELLLQHLGDVGGIEGL